jgi:filamentous hemagglutinin
VNYLQGLAASEVKQIADTLGKGAQAEAARAALHGIVGCAGAAGQGAACASGALGASAGSILNSLMGSPEGLTSEQVEARRNLVTSLVAGIATAAGAEAATAGTAAALETSQNWGQVAYPLLAWQLERARRWGSVIGQSPMCRTRSSTLRSK